MAIEIKVPEMGESIVEATVGAWVKNEGDQIEAGETILELETEKVNLEVTAPATGTLETVNTSEGEVVNVGTVLGTINTELIGKVQTQENINDSKKEPELPDSTQTINQEEKDINITPVAKNLADKHSINIDSIKGSGRAGKITIDDLQGGTFTITNGGIYGSMLSTPILNPPQSAVLGMHNIIQRRVVVNGNVEVRPVMYLALSYDHRLIDGKEAVSFLKIVKESLEQPQRLFLNI